MESEEGVERGPIDAIIDEDDTQDVPGSILSDAAEEEQEIVMITVGGPGTGSMWHMRGLGERRALQTAMSEKLSACALVPQKRHRVRRAG